MCLIFEHVPPVRSRRREFQPETKREDREKERRCSNLLVRVGHKPVWELPCTQTQITITVSPTSSTGSPVIKADRRKFYLFLKMAGQSVLSDTNDRPSVRYSSVIVFPEAGAKLDHKFLASQKTQR